MYDGAYVRTLGHARSNSPPMTQLVRQDSPISCAVGGSWGPQQGYLFVYAWASRPMQQYTPHAVETSCPADTFPEMVAPPDGRDRPIDNGEARECHPGSTAYCGGITAPGAQAAKM